MVTEHWQIEDQSTEYQLRYWHLRAEAAEQREKSEKRRKAPETLAALENELKQAHETIAMLRHDIAVWKEVSGKGWDRVSDLESEGTAALLKRERDHWQERWRNAVSRIATLLEHQGNVELLEDRLAACEQRSGGGR